MTDPSDKMQAALAGGERVGGYAIERELGRGGMGVVYLARHVLLDRHVALKTLLPGKLGTTTQIERFLKEARLSCRIHHPNVVEVYDAGQYELIHYLVMQYVNGLNLKEVVKEQGGPLPWRVALKVMRLATRGTAALHAHQMIHRDIKPSNIMVSGDGRQVVLMDFGLAREERASDLTETGMIVGTPHFMSPEQCLGEVLDKRSDIFSLGATLYFLLTAKLPFGGGRVPQVIRDIAAGKPPRPPHEENPFVPRAVSELVLVAMAHKPADRFADAEAMGRAVADLLKLPPSADVAVTDTTTNAAAVTASRRVRRALAPLELLPTETVPTWRDPRRVGIIVGAILTIGLLIALMTQVGPSRPTASPPKPTPTKKPEPKTTEATNQTIEGTLKPTAVPAPAEPRAAFGPAQDNMVEIPAGFVQMGMSVERVRAHYEPLVTPRNPRLLDEALRLARPNEPEKRVWVPAFHMDKYEVTNAEYSTFVRALGKTPPRHWPGGAIPAGQEMLPVTNISHRDAEAYATWKSKRLPTGEQWLRAFRGDTEWLFPWGDTWDESRCNVAENHQFRYLAPVTATPADVTPLGVVNMVGNAREFLRDTTFKNGPEQAFVKGCDYRSPGAIHGVGPIRWALTVLDEPDERFGFRCVRE